MMTLDEWGKLQAPFRNVRMGALFRYENTVYRKISNTQARAWRIPATVVTFSPDTVVEVLP